MKTIYVVVAATGLASLGLAATRAPADALDGRDMPRRGPPPEAIEACADKSEGEACSVEIPGMDEVIEGTCVPALRGEEGELFCRPSHRHAPGDA